MSDWEVRADYDGWLRARLEFEGGGSVRIHAPEPVARAAMEAVERGIEGIAEAERDLYSRD